jgi:hypothetical protein
MNVTYQDQARQWGEGYVLLQQATNILEDILGPSADRVAVEWDREQDERGRLVYRLTLSDLMGKASAVFAPEDLRSPARVRSRLLGLWGDLLQARSDAQIKKLQELVNTEE